MLRYGGAGSAQKCTTILQYDISRGNSAAAEASTKKQTTDGGTTGSDGKVKVKIKMFFEVSAVVFFNFWPHGFL